MGNMSSESLLEAKMKKGSFPIQVLFNKHSYLMTDVIDRGRFKHESTWSLTSFYSIGPDANHEDAD